MATTNVATAERAIMEGDREMLDVSAREVSATAAHEPATGLKLTALQQKRRNQRNLAIGIALAAFVGLFYIITIIKLGTGAHH